MDFSTTMRVGNVQTGRIIVNKMGCKFADALIDQAINYGIYVLTDGLGNWYVGQADDINRRLQQHAKSVAKRTFKVVGKFFVNGGKDELRIAEQYMMDLVKKAINEGDGKGNIANKIRAIREKGGRLSSLICK